MGALDVLLKLAEATKLFFPWAQEFFFQKTLPLSLSTILFGALGVGIVLWRNWTKIRSLKRELERAKVGPPNASDGDQPQKPTPKWETEYERFPEQGVLYALEYPLDGRGDLADRISASEPRCLGHPGAPMVRADLEDGAEEDWVGTNVYRGWKCDGCGHTIAESLNKRLKVLAKSNLAKKLKPEFLVV